MLLAGDVGGTKTNLMICTNKTKISDVKVFTFLNCKFNSLESLVENFIRGLDQRPDAAVLAVAGPVIDEAAIITNLQWHISENALINTTGIGKVTLINDLEATAYAIPFLAEKEFTTLNSGNPVKGGTIAVIAPGTGLGESFLTWDGINYHAHPTEGSHADFAPSNDLEISLLRYLLKSYDHVSYERICSGIGIPNIYYFLKNDRGLKEPVWLKEKISLSSDITATILNSAVEEGSSCEICSTTLKIFISILSMEAGNMALKVMSRGGVYIGGGIPPRIVTHLQAEFMKKFANKGRMSEILSNIPVKVILNPNIAVIGAAQYGIKNEAIYAPDK